MIIDFNKIDSMTFPGMDNGTGTMSARMYNDDSYRKIPTSIHPGGSIGTHKQNSGDDMNYIISGTGKAFCDGGRGITDSWSNAHLSSMFRTFYHKYRRGRPGYANHCGEEMSTYIFEKPLIRGKMLKRKSQFTALVEIDGEELVAHIPTTNRGLQGQVCIASRGKVKKLCMEVKAGTSVDVSIRALRGSGGLESP